MTQGLEPIPLTAMAVLPMQVHTVHLHMQGMTGHELLLRTAMPVPHIQTLKVCLHGGLVYQLQACMPCIYVYCRYIVMW